MTYFIAVAVVVALIAIVRTVRSSAYQTIARDPDAELLAGPPVSVTVGGETYEVSTEIQTLLQERRKIEAIKKLREATGLGLKESKDVVDAAERVMRGESDESHRADARGTRNRAPEAESFAGPPITVTVEGRTFEISAQIQALLRERRMIDAIKELRRVTGLGLKESKDIIDEAERVIRGDK